MELLRSDEAKLNIPNDTESCIDANSSALVQAHVIRSNPSAQYPSFLKQLHKSHLSGKYYLGLPKKFCDAHLPSHDDTIILVDENEKEYTMKFSLQKNRLSGGWRCFSITHNLMEGDAVLFHLIEPCKFKVYIVRASKLTENGGASSLKTTGFQNGKAINLVVKTEDQMEGNMHIGKLAMQPFLNSLPVDSHRDKRARLTDSQPAAEQSTDAGVHSGSEILQGVRFPDHFVYFKDVKGFEDFRIQLDGLILDSEIPTHLRTKYYELCCNQKTLLHKRLIKGLSRNLAVVMISETVNIADSIRASNLATSLHHLECWEKTLKAFEDLGMAVGFLRDRLQKLVSLSRQSLEILESKRSKSVRAEDEIRNFETTASTVKSLLGSLDGEFEELKLKNEAIGFQFQELAAAPW